MEPTNRVKAGESVVLDTYPDDPMAQSMAQSVAQTHTMYSGPVLGHEPTNQPQYTGMYSPQPANCSWYAQRDENNVCKVSPLAVAQSLFALPSKIVEPALMSLPAGLVPLVGLGVNVGAWWLVWKGVEKYWLGPMMKGK